MKTIKKFKLEQNESRTTVISVPEFAPILNVAIDHGTDIYIFVLWEDEIKEREDVTIKCYVGDSNLDTNYGKYLGTVLAFFNPVHIFEVRKNAVNFDNTTFEVTNA